jgi:proline racemase
VRHDLCFGGVFYALVDAAQIGLAIAPENSRALAMAGVARATASRAAGPAPHPVTPGR